MEQNSEHVIAKAIVEHAKTKVKQIPKSTDFKAIPGKGAKAKVGANRVYVGSPNLLKELNIEVSDERLVALQEQGKTVVFTVVDGKLAGAFALADKIREESRVAVKELKAKGVKVYMLTGDAEDGCKRRLKGTWH